MLCVNIVCPRNRDNNWGFVRNIIKEFDLAMNSKS